MTPETGREFEQACGYRNQFLSTPGLERIDHRANAFSAAYRRS